MCTGHYRVTTVDANAGHVVNTAVAHADDGTISSPPVSARIQVRRLLRPERDKDGVNIKVDINVTGNNKGGHGGDSTGATANHNGHIHGIVGGFAKAHAHTRAHAHAKAHSGSGHHGN